MRVSPSTYRGRNDPATRRSSPARVLLIAAYLCALSVLPAQAQFVDLSATAGPTVAIPASDLVTQPVADAPFNVQVTVTPIELRDTSLTIRGRIEGPGGASLVEMEITVGPFFRINQATVTYGSFREHRLNRTAPILREAARQGGLLPAGPYAFVAEAVFRNTVVASDRVTFRLPAADIGIDLAGPGAAAGSALPTIRSEQPLFSWFGVADRYDIAIFEVPADASQRLSDEAIAAQLPVYRETNIETTVWTYPLVAEPLQPGRTYAWQVTASTGRRDDGAGLRQRSPVYRFRMASTLANDDPPREDGRTLTIDGPDTPIPSGTRVSFRALLGSDLQPTGTSDNDTDRSAAFTEAEWAVYPHSLGEVTPTGVFTAADTTLAGVITARRGRQTATRLIRVHHATDTPTLTIISPRDGAVTPFPNPPIAWRVTGAGPDTLRVELTLSSGSDGPPLWTRTVSAAQPVFSYPPDAPVLQNGTFQLRARLLDDETELDNASVTLQHTRPARLGYELFQDWTLARQARRFDDSVRVVATVGGDSLSPGIRTQIEQTGAVVERVAGPYAQLRVPYPRLTALAGVSALRSAALPAPRRTFSSRSLSSHETPATPRHFSPAQTETRDTALPDTVRIGVIEFGFDEAQIRSQAPGPVTAMSFRSDGSILGRPAETRHGTATAGALLDAWPTNGPVLHLHLIAVDTELSFLDAIQAVGRTAAMDALSCSISWMNGYDDFDGTSAFSRTLDDRLAPDRILVAAAGNFGTSHWETRLADSGERLRIGDRDTLSVTLRAGQTYDLVMSWNEWSAPQTDLDLQVLDAAGRPLARRNGLPVASLNRQEDGGYELPVERIRGIQVAAADTASVQIVVPVVRRGEALPHVELYMNPAPVRSRPEAMPESSLAPGVAPTRSVAVATAASGAWRSQGPTNDGRPRPDFAASGTTSLNGQTVRGTSFATPRVAAAFGLVRAAQPGWSRDDILQFLRRQAASSGEKRLVDGWGRLSIDALLDALQQQ